MSDFAEVETESPLRPTTHFTMALQPLPGSRQYHWPQVALKVVWSCSQCGRQLEEEVISREDSWYEREVSWMPACPLCDREAYQEQQERA